MHMKKTLLFYTFCLISITAFSQLKGNITDTQGKPLAFVNIYLENTYTGTTSNDDGNYQLDITQLGKNTVVFQYLGYKTIKKEINITSFPHQLDVSLEEESVSLDEVIVKSNDNPANRIIKNTIANRKANLEKINSYNADFYSRGLMRIKDAPEKIMGQDIGDFDGSLDSTRSGIVYLSETISKIKYQFPDKLKENIIASKVSGNDNGFSFNTASDVDFNFYKNTVELENEIISPIASYAFNYYRYKLEGVFYDDQNNLINKIKVTPKRKNDRAFSGYVYIIEDQWALYALELEITGERAQIIGLDTITIKQSFKYTNADAIWVLISQSLDFKYGIFGFNGDGRYTAVYSNHNFKPEFSKNTFSREVVSVEKEANKKDSIYWSKLRPVPLTDEEQSDYTKKDSLQVIKKSKKYLDSTDTVSNKFQLTDIVFGYNYQNSYKNWNAGFTGPLEGISFNTVQGWNSSLGLYFRKNYDDYNRWYAFNINANYGASDKRFRPYGSIVAKFNNISKPVISLSAGVQAVQFNASNPISKMMNSISTLFFENNYMKLYDRSYIDLGYSQELFNGFHLFSTLAYEKRSPLFNTTNYSVLNVDDKNYTSNNPIDEGNYNTAPFETHNIVKLNLQVRIKFDQKYMTHPNSKYNLSSNKYPTLFLGYEKGMGATNSNYNFDEIKARLTQNFAVGNKGSLSYNIAGGKFFNADNIAFMDFKHFNSNLTHVRLEKQLNSFSILPYYASSTNDAYAELHAEHNFKGYILNKIPLLNKLNFNMIIGAHSLSTSNNIPYHEFSIGVDNIGWGKFRFLRVDYVRSYQGSGYNGDAFMFGLSF